MKPLFLTSPHAGEFIPPEASWLQTVDPIVQLRDVDRFITELYSDVAAELELSLINTNCHRYVIDQNRLPEHIDPLSVEGYEESHFPSYFVSGIHWVKTTHKEVLMSQPMTKKLHEKLIKDYYLPFHQQIEQQFKNLKQKFSEVYQLDLHSMPSVGTAFHQDPGKERPEVVVSDFKGKCSDLSFVELVINSYKKAGFQVNYNDPYIGGGITQKYGHPSRHQHCVQVELKRNLYMNEDTKEKNQLYENTKKRLAQAIKEIYLGIKEDEIF